MALLLIFGVALLAAVLVSERAERTVLSTAVLFLATGLAFGSLIGGPDERVVRVRSSAPASSTSASARSAPESARGEHAPFRDRAAERERGHRAG